MKKTKKVENSKTIDNRYEVLKEIGRGGMGKKMVFSKRYRSLRDGNDAMPLITFEAFSTGLIPLER